MPKKKVQKKRGGPESLYARAMKSSIRKRDSKDEDAVPTSASVSSESDEDAEDASTGVEDGAVRGEAETADGKPKRMKKKLKRLSVCRTSTLSKKCCSHLSCVFPFLATSGVESRILVTLLCSGFAWAHVLRSLLA